MTLITTSNVNRQHLDEKFNCQQPNLDRFALSFLLAYILGYYVPRTNAHKYMVRKQLSGQWAVQITVPLSISRYILPKYKMTIYTQ